MQALKEVSMEAVKQTVVPVDACREGVKGAGRHRPSNGRGRLDSVG